MRRLKGFIFGEAFEPLVRLVIVAPWVLAGFALGGFINQSPRHFEVVWPSRHDDIYWFIKKIDLFDATMIATPLERALGTRIQNVVVGVQKVRVESSRTYPTGTIVPIYFAVRDEYRTVLPPFDFKGELKDDLPVGRRVLLVGETTKDRRLAIRGTAQDYVTDIVNFPFGENDSSGVIGRLYFETNRTQLPGIADPKQRLVQALADAIAGTSNENLNRIAEAAVYLSNFYNNINPNGNPDDDYSRMWSRAVANESPYRQSMIHLSLNTLCYWGYADKFFRDVRASVIDPTAFPDGVGGPSFYEQPTSNFALPKDFKHDPPPTEDELLELLAMAKSPTVAAFYIPGLKKPSVANMKRLARCLNFTDPRPRHAFIKKLAEWFGEPAPEEPITLEKAPFTKQYPGLDAATARWKAKLKAL